jgi:hypothetical protein
MSRRLLALIVVLVFSFFSRAVFCEEAAKPAEKPAVKAEKQPAKEKAGDRFMRLRRNDKGNPIAMETAVTSYISANDSRPGVTVDLIGAVHVGERSYYDQLNELFSGYDVVLYELVAPQGTIVTKEARGKGGSSHPVGMLQDGMKSMLGLEHQLDCIDYTKKNFVHADMSPEEFNKSMTERGESFMKMFLTMMGQGMAQQQKEGGGDVAILMALFSRDRNLKLKIAMAEQLENAEGQLDVLGGPEGSTIISERNKKALDVLKKELEAGKKKIGIFYGAGHFADMQDRLLKDFTLKRSGEKWLVAWALEKAAAKASETKKTEPPKVEEKKAEEKK